MKISIAQLNVISGKVTQNIEYLYRWLRSEKQLGELIVLPECFNSGYVFDKYDDMYSLCEDFTDSYTVTMLSTYAKEFNTTFVAGIPERLNDQLYNSVIVVNSMGLQHTYRKLSQTSIDKRYFSRGSDLLCFIIGGVKIGVMICFDLWFPELTRKYVSLGVDVLIHPSNFGSDTTLKIAQATAAMNNITIITCNRIGLEVCRDFEASYCGRSQVVSSDGEVVLQADSSEQLINFDYEKPVSAEKTILGIDLKSELNQICSILNK